MLQPASTGCFFCGQVDLLIGLHQSSILVGQLHRFILARQLSFIGASEKEYIFVDRRIDYHILVHHESIFLDQCIDIVYQRINYKAIFLDRCIDIVYQCIGYRLSAHYISAQSKGPPYIHVTINKALTQNSKTIKFKILSCCACCACTVLAHSLF